MIAGVDRHPVRGASSAPGRGHRWWELSGDLRIHLFAGLFALGTIHHEIEFVLEQVPIGPLTEYMERWGRAIPTIGWPSTVGIALHLANVAISLLLITLPWRRELLCLLAVTFLLSQLASPARIGSHNGLMTGALLVTLMLGSAEWLERLLRRGRRRTDWYGWTLTGLAWACALTYFFAFFYKLNPSWFSDGSTAPDFLIEPVEPVMDGLDVPTVYRSVLAMIAIYGTLLIEPALPLLLFWRRTRLLGCFVGLVFHLPMLAYGIGNFPTLVVACYAAFLSVSQAGELLRRCLARPTVTRLTGTVVLGGFGIWALQRAPQIDWPSGDFELDSVVALADNGLTSATIVLFVYVTLVLGAWLLERRAAARFEPGRANGNALRPAAGAPDRDRRWPAAGTALAAAAVLLMSGVFVYTNLARFFGLPSVGAMIMYSGIGPDRDDHLLMPRVSAIDSFSFASIVLFEPRGIRTSEASEFGTFVEWLADRDRPYRVNLNHLRYHMNRICGSAPGGTVRLTLRKEDGDALHFENVCAEPAMLWYLPLPAASECDPSCGSMIRRWARGRLGPD